MVFALLALGLITVCLTMMVLGWTLDAVWTERPMRERRPARLLHVREGDRAYRLRAASSPPRWANSGRS
jgi:hypothetical protein